ncbi:hypothetical protein CONCODRAFT_17855 [Conidiobolus coronatus NRRL 28638]|uniref:Transcription factor domain-containing protein n=1 Tax=Conidiobolus coronatus (strain ATCC 28846 / CBS 209.66 / NRRL 28638) TaxID=796925 RepID=A0A137P589_CONC2|nr:hypothetical protein CONCODRAFT_17855 [Conidiobolus coronatus NRRL 28638]|eukprot:KXN70176.1 hypothetical protein CONCODRAFT_17855 [Conidiobolus coronatus NRRL 28638]
MKVLSSLIEYKVCKKCQVKITRSSSYCKGCQLKLDQAVRFFAYDQEPAPKTNKKKVIQENVWVVNPSTTKKHIQVTQICPLERNTFTHLTNTGFESLEHFSNYIINSDKVCISQTILTLSWDLKSMPHINWILDSNQNIIPAVNAVKNTDAYQIPPVARSLQILTNPVFWEELIRLYITKFHSIVPVFNLKYFNPRTMDQALLSAIYFCGYQFYEHKTDQLSEYMESFSQSNLKRIRFKPSMVNAQALVIYSYVYKNQGNLALGRIYDTHLIKMCECLGIHIDSNLFDEPSNHNRRILFLRMATVNHNMNGGLKPYLCFVPDLPEYNSSLYHESWQTLPTAFSHYGDLDPAKRELDATFTSINHEFSNQILYLLSIKKEYKLTKEEYQALGKSNLEQLTIIFNAHMEKYELLRLKYPMYGTEIDGFINLLKLSYYGMSITIVDQLKIMQKKSEKYALSKIYDACNELTELTLSSAGNDIYSQFYVYLTCLTYISYYKHLNKAQKLVANTKFQKIYEKLLPMENLNNFIYLIIQIGKKLINE